jgi:hypothetical protein
MWMNSLENHASPLFLNQTPPTQISTIHHSLCWVFEKFTLRQKVESGKSVTVSEKKIDHVKQGIPFYKALRSLLIPKLS